MFSSEVTAVGWKSSMLSFHQLKQCCSTAKSAEVAMPWGYIDQWLGFASPVDITGLDGFAGQHRKASFGGKGNCSIPSQMGANWTRFSHNKPAFWQISKARAECWLSLLNLFWLFFFVEGCCLCWCCCSFCGHTVCMFIFFLCHHSVSNSGL